MRKSLPGIVKIVTIFLLIGLSISLFACATSSSEGIKLIAENGEFSRSYISVAAGEEVTIIFENRDSERHNFAIYRTEAANQEIFVGEIITGPRTITYTFTAPETPDTYFFRCDVHPDTMKGTFRVYGSTS